MYKQTCSSYPMVDSAVWDTLGIKYWVYHCLYFLYSFSSLSSFHHEGMMKLQTKPNPNSIPWQSCWYEDTIGNYITFSLIWKYLDTFGFQVYFTKPEAWYLEEIELTTQLGKWARPRRSDEHLIGSTAGEPLMAIQQQDVWNDEILLYFHFRICSNIVLRYSVTYNILAG